MTHTVQHVRWAGPFNNFAPILFEPMYGMLTMGDSGAK